MLVFGWGEQTDCVDPEAEDCEPTKYWLVRNSHSTDQGSGGIFKYLRGVNHGRIEEDAGVAFASPIPERPLQQSSCLTLVNGDQLEPAQPASKCFVKNTCPSHRMALIGPGISSWDASGKESWQCSHEVLGQRTELYGLGWQFKYLVPPSTDGFIEVPPQSWYGDETSYKFAADEADGTASYGPRPEFIELRRCVLLFPSPSDQEYDMTEDKEGFRYEVTEDMELGDLGIGMYLGTTLEYVTWPEELSGFSAELKAANEERDRLLESKKQQPPFERAPGSAKTCKGKCGKTDAELEGKCESWCTMWTCSLAGCGACETSELLERSDYELLRREKRGAWAKTFLNLPQAEGKTCATLGVGEYSG